MKQMTNQVNPKAGTLKQTKGNVIQNASKKLIAFVLMLAITLQTGVVMAASDDNNDTCCVVERKERNNKFAKAIRLALPSSENIRKADSEMTSNLYKSLRESKVKKFSAQFKLADAEMNESFKAETSIKNATTGNADNAIHDVFNAENIAFNNDVASADQDINNNFTVEEKGISLSIDQRSADEWMNSVFQAENISTPSAANFGIADAEIHNLYLERTNLKIASR
jgi:hypothetical protein